MGGRIETPRQVPSGEDHQLAKPLWIMIGEDLGRLSNPVGRLAFRPPALRSFGWELVRRCGRIRGGNTELAFRIRFRSKELPFGL